MDLRSFFGQEKMRFWVQNVGNLVRFETPEFIGNIPDVACESQVLGKILVGGVERF